MLKRSGAHPIKNYRAMTFILALIASSNSYALLLAIGHLKFDDNHSIKQRDKQKIF